VDNLPTWVLWMTGVAVGVSPGLGRSVGRYIPQAFGADSLLEGDRFELLVPRHESLGFSAREASHIAFFGLLVAG
jgi:hypothetical protein